MKFISSLWEYLLDDYFIIFSLGKIQRLKFSEFQVLFTWGPEMRRQWSLWGFIGSEQGWWILLLFLYMLMFLCNFPLLCCNQHLRFSGLFIFCGSIDICQEDFRCFVISFINLSIGWGAQDYMTVGLTLVSNCTEIPVCVTLALCQVKHLPCFLQESSSQLWHLASTIQSPFCL